MKKILCIFFLLFVLKHGFAQYTVTKVVGNVHNDMSKEKISAGSKLNDNDKLSWKTPFSENDMIRAIAAGKGVFIITRTPGSEKDENEIVEFVKKSLKIKAKAGYLSGRAGNDELIPASLETEGRVNSKNLFTVENKYLFDGGTYNVSDGSRFFLQIEYLGSGPIIRQLKTIGDTLIVNAADFEILDRDMAATAKYKLGFFSKKNKSSKALIEIKPAFDYINEMETIICVIIKESKEKDQSKLKDECYAEVYEALGKPADIQFNTAFYKLVSLPQKN